ncbi:glycine zipper 2TM domain-containing protein [Sediminicurvatus halobius]|uniref:Glycine zipper 2TM domain-containing protein n=1 Tax=Sediminicurvatus halobius TaxID=2182432 RepID=A0A2U2N5E4_9GAMM|nr:glycine zipper 2TM domain-containing protein [Spiribacter halobius]PWG64303.1 hypothetical protein DEM34_05310 [Spiribacter halobius]UEX79355.1 glycine zipper 2TM domain-containing protein [Spiribacter halobius]
MIRPITVLGLAAALVLPGAALAGGDRHVHYTWAPVTHVEPVTRDVRVTTPREECWDERVTYVEEPERNRAGLVVGGIIGGIAGNQIGGGDGRRVATVAGTILGAGIGDELANRDRHARVHDRWETRCEVVEEVHWESRTIGYDVHYRYDGEEYVVRTDRRPGDRVRLRVGVTPEL